jgi:hypothetical protein
MNESGASLRKQFSNFQPFAVGFAYPPLRWLVWTMVP